MYHRVFTSSNHMPQPADLQAMLREAGFDAPLDVKGDDLGWTTIDVPLAAPLHIERFLTEEDDLRDELDTWAAVAESWGADGPLLERIIGTRQLFTVRGAGESPAVELAARFLAERTGGLHQADGRGLLRPDGTALLSGD